MSDLDKLAKIDNVTASWIDILRRFSTVRVSATLKKINYSIANELTMLAAIVNDGSAHNSDRIVAGKSLRQLIESNLPKLKDAPPEYEEVRILIESEELEPDIKTALDSAQSLKELTDDQKVE